MNNDTFYIIFFIIFGIISSLIAILNYLNITFDYIMLRSKGGVPDGFLIFIIGTNGVGKSTTAMNVSKRLGNKKTPAMTIIEVNALRETLRSQEALYKKAGESENWVYLKESTFHSDNPTHDNTPSNCLDYFQNQCDLLSPVILNVADYFLGQNKSVIFEGITILPTKLHEIKSRHVLFVHLYVTNEKTLEKRLYQKANNNPDKVGKYTYGFDIILKNADEISKDFQNIRNIKNDLFEIHSLPIDNTTLSVHKVTNRIIKEVRKISYPWG
ncbi:MAG: hypothetical protein FWH53_10310 [Leptospirales bacterium]|nr:hypothetical protein [Leptospirales bacterium]